jgi:hypothetical protein
MPRNLKSLAGTCALMVLGAALVAEERIDYAAVARIRKEGRERSQILRTLHYLADVHGPRLTGSPNHKAAAEWALKQLREWGLENAHLEPWEFGHPGWLNERFAGFVVSPVKDSLVGEVVAWTPGTNGPVRANAVRIEPPRCVPSASGPRPEAAIAGPPAQAPENCPTQEDFTAALDKVKGKVGGKIVLVGAHAKVPVNFNPAPLRRDDEQVRRQYDPDNPAPSPFANQPETPRDPARMNANKINDAGREHGQIRAFQNRTYDTSKALPTVVLRNEDYGRISRIIDDGTPVELEFNIVNQSYPEGHTSYNAVAEIPGTDKKAEIVMLGGHLDSWHSATGATDNGIGCTIMMEAVRILKAAGFKPRRTVRIALWGGEEQGLLGSKAYVKEHFGTFESPKPEFATFDGYFNVDSGTGRIRGASVFGPKAAGTALREIFAPFEDFGIVGASTTQRRRSSGTDSTSFNEAGLPGIGLGQDPIQYNSHTWHTNLDTYERIVEDDAIKAAIAVAGAVYHVATRDEMLPRFPKDQMPAPAPAAPVTP